MDEQKLMELLRASLDRNPENRKSAEVQLAQVHTINGFVQTIFQIVMQNTLDHPVRQAGAVYLKNLVTRSWIDHDVKPWEPIPFLIHEQDRAMLRSVILNAIVHAPELIRVQLLVCVSHIIESDLSGDLAQMVHQHISILLRNPDSNAWNCALVTMYQQVKTFEYKQYKERIPLIEAMKLLLPTLYQLMVNLFNDHSEQSVLLQKQILKIFYALTRYNLPLDLINHDTFSQWMTVCLQIADRSVPDCSHLDDDEKTEFPYWKLKKWALHIIFRMSERYGRMHNGVSKKYEEFVYLIITDRSEAISNVILKILEQYRTRVYISPRVLTYVLLCLKHAVYNANSWNLIIMHMADIFNEIIFPIMSLTDADQQLWDANPCEYIKLKFKIRKDYKTPVYAAKVLLRAVCKKRKSCLLWAMELIALPNADNKQKDGAFHMIGTLADILLKSTPRVVVETMLTTYVFPQFKNPAGHLRARAYWVLYYFREVAVNNKQIQTEIKRIAMDTLFNDNELTVKVEGALGLYMFLNSQDKADKEFEGQIKDITKKLLIMIRDTWNEKLLIFMQKFLFTYTNQLLPDATEICDHLAVTFSQMLDSEPNAANGLLDTIDILLTVIEDHPNVMQNLHSILINIVGFIFQNNINDFYEFTFSLVHVLTSKTISLEMWQMLELVYQVFIQDGMNYFNDIVPALYNYVTVDTPAFLSTQNRLLAIFEMCKIMLTTNPGEGPECCAAKLLEVIILQCKGQIDAMIPNFVELALTRLTQEIQSSELRTMCLEVVIAALYYNAQLLLSILENMSQPNKEPIISYFIKQWLQDTECFLGIHDRKLCVLGWCALISLRDAKPPVLYEVGNKIMPALILLFDGLKRAYEAPPFWQEEEEKEDDFFDESELSSDEDEENLPNYLFTLAEFAKNKASNKANKVEIKNEESDHMDVEELGDLNQTVPESFKTAIDEQVMETGIDEFWEFEKALDVLYTNHSWYMELIRDLTPEQEKALQEILDTAEQRKEAKELELRVNSMEVDN